MQRPFLLVISRMHAARVASHIFCVFPGAHPPQVPQAQPSLQVQAWTVLSATRIAIVTMVAAALGNFIWKDNKFEALWWGFFWQLAGSTVRVLGVERKREVLEVTVFVIFLLYL
ncbi:hypothetical protein BKA57DRAFT_477915 [Linnemannia elongata]|nr:hypothetical protein BKA57DRAFT_477915 [Linnemannia elongata]